MRAEIEAGGEREVRLIMTAADLSVPPDGCV